MTAVFSLVVVVRGSMRAFALALLAFAAFACVGATPTYPACATGLTCRTYTIQTISSGDLTYDCATIDAAPGTSHPGK